MATETAETTAYLILGLIVAFSWLTLFIGSMVLRYRNLKKDMALIEQLADDN